MAFTNTEYLYQNLPSRFRREDKDLFLKRYLQFFGETLDGYDAAFDAFFGLIDSATADVRWIEFWLENLFGWSWFPEWFTIAEKRRLYSHFGKHLARRGTRRGIELWLLDFGIIARVHTRTLPWGEFVYGETHYAISEPLHLIVEILFIQSAEADLHVWGEGAFGEFYYSAPKPLFTIKEMMDLIRFVQPHSQEIILILRNSAQTNVSEVVPQRAEIIYLLDADGSFSTDNDGAFLIENDIGSNSTFLNDGDGAPSIDGDGALLID